MNNLDIDYQIQISRQKRLLKKNKRIDYQLNILLDKHFLLGLLKKKRDEILNI